MKKCEKCGGKVWWLHMAKEVPERLVETDYVMCEDCETIYKRVIHTEVLWIERQTSKVTGDVEE